MRQPAPPAPESSSGLQLLPQYGDLAIIDLAQGVTTGGSFYLVALVIVQTLTPPSMVFLMIGALLWSGYGAWRLEWRDAALSLGVALGVSANLFAPVLLFLLFLAAWLRSDRPTTLPWIAMGIALLGVGSGMAQPALQAALPPAQQSILAGWYLTPLAFGALGCAVLSQFIVAIARQENIERSLQLLGPSWLSVLAVVLASVAMLQAGLHLPHPG